MINPEAIPKIPDVRPVAHHARTLGKVGREFAHTGSQINSAWQGLGHAYHAPEAGQLLHATAPVQSIAASVGDNIAGVEVPLNNYVTEVQLIHSVVEGPSGLRKQADQLNKEIQAKGGDWKKDNDLIQREQSLLHQISVQVAAFEDAQRRCANAINAFYGGTQWHSDNGDGKMDPKAGEFGFSATQYDLAAHQTGKNALPWGTLDKHDRGFWGDVKAYGGGLWDGFKPLGKLGLAAGVYGLPFGGLLDHSVGVPGFKRGEMGKTLIEGGKGFGKLALAAGLYSPATFGAGAVLDHTIGVPGFKRGAMLKTLVDSGKGIIAYDEWKHDKSRAAGNATFNIVTALVGTKGAGAGLLRGAGGVAEASRISTIARAGTILVRTGEAVGKLPSVTDIAIGAAKRIPRLTDLLDKVLPTARQSHINIPHHVDTRPVEHTPLPTGDYPKPHPNLPGPVRQAPHAPKPGSVGHALDHDPRQPAYHPHADPTKNPPFPKAHEELPKTGGLGHHPPPSSPPPSSPPPSSPVDALKHEAQAPHSPIRVNSDGTFDIPHGHKVVVRNGWVTIRDTHGNVVLHERSGPYTDLHPHGNPSGHSPPQEMASHSLPSESSHPTVNEVIPRHPHVTEAEKATIMQKLHRVIDGNYGHNGEYEVRLDESHTKIEQNAVKYHATITKKGATNPVGELTNIVVRDDEGQLSEHMLGFHLDNNAQGQGIASTVNKSLKDWYRGEVPSREVYAHGVGADVWAKDFNFKFKSRQQAENILSPLENRVEAAQQEIRHYHEMPEGPEKVRLEPRIHGLQEQVKIAQGIARRIKDPTIPFDSEQFPTAHQIHEAGGKHSVEKVTVGDKEQSTSLIKEALQDVGWYGIERLD